MLIFFEAFSWGFQRTTFQSLRLLRVPELFSTSFAWAERGMQMPFVVLFAFSFWQNLHFFMFCFAFFPHNFLGFLLEIFIF